MVLLEFFTTIEMWWQEESVHAHAQLWTEESFCWKVLLVLPIWDVCAGSSDRCLMC